MSESSEIPAESVADLGVDKAAEGSRTNVTSRRKRGYDDEFRQTFEEFTKKISKTLKEWKIEFGRDVSQINVTLKNLTESIQELKTEIAGIRKEHSEIKKNILNLETRQTKVAEELASFHESLQFHSKEYEDIKDKLEVHSKELKNLNLLNTELAEIKVQNRKLRSDINANEQRERQLNIEVVGIPEHKDENLTDIILKIGKCTDLIISEDDIVHINRVTPKVKIQGRPRNIVVKLRTRQLKDNIIYQARKRRLSTKELEIQGKAVPVYINEHLTVYNKNLLKKTKEVAKIKEYQFTWTKNCKIHVRKAVTTPAIFVVDEEDLKKIV